MIFPEGFKPMLAGKADVNKLQFPLIVSKKIDGFRTLICNGTAYSRNLKPIPNKHVQSKIAEMNGLFDGCDGELIVGNMSDPDVFRNTSSGVMSFDGEPDFLFWAFDRWDMSHLPYSERIKHIPSMCRLGYELINSLEDLVKKEEEYLAEGMEGLMVRSLSGKYKYGRSSVKESYLLKVKRFEDSEAKVVGFKERMHNANEATKDYLGHTKRSSHKENMHPMDTLGAITVELSDGQLLDIGSGFNDLERKEIWTYKDLYVGKLAKFRYTKIGMKDLPRFPTFLGWRDEADLS